MGRYVASWASCSIRSILSMVPQFRQNIIFPLLHPHWSSANRHQYPEALQAGTAPRREPPLVTGQVHFQQTKMRLPWTGTVNTIHACCAEAEGTGNKLHSGLNIFSHLPPHDHASNPEIKNQQGASTTQHNFFNSHYSQWKQFVLCTACQVWVQPGIYSPR